MIHILFSKECPQNLDKDLKNLRKNAKNLPYSHWFFLLCLRTTVLYLQSLLLCIRISTACLVEKPVIWLTYLYIERMRSEECWES